MVSFVLKVLSLQVLSVVIMGGVALLIVDDREKAVSG